MRSRWIQICRSWVQAFLDAGGRLLITGASGVTDNDIAFGAWGPRRRARTRSPEATMPVRWPIWHRIPLTSPCSHTAVELRVTTGTSLGDVHDPYLDRDVARFSGHLHAPCNRVRSVMPSVWRRVRGDPPRPSERHHRVGSVAFLQVIDRVVARPPCSGAACPRPCPRPGAPHHEFNPTQAAMSCICCMPTRCVH